VGLGYSDLRLEAKVGKTKKYHGHFGLLSRRQTLETDMSQTVRRNPVWDTCNNIFRCRHFLQWGSPKITVTITMFLGVTPCSMVEIYRLSVVTCFLTILSHNILKKTLLHPITGCSTFPSVLCSKTSSV